MGVWETIIGIIERTWHDKPRKDVVNALVELRSVMVECQRSYDEYQDLCKRGAYRKWLTRSRKICRDVGTIFEDRKAKWLRSVDKIVAITVEINEVLQIFSPEVHREVQRMAEYEFERKVSEAAPIQLRMALMYSGAESGFGIAIQHLDAFIKQNFKLEEIYAAKKKLRSD